MKNPKVRKGIIIASSSLVAIIVLIGLFFTFVSFSPALITYNERKQISNDLFGVSNSRWYYGSKNYDTLRCYGRENGYILVFVGIGDEFDYEYIADIDGIAFANPRHFSLYAYKDGKVIDIADAYQQGLISREALLKAKEYHDQCQKEIAAAWGK